MTIVDTHCHVGTQKYEPVESLLYHMDHSGVEKAVMIQYMGNSDNAYVLACKQQYPDRLQAVIIAAPDDDGSSVRILAEEGAVGIRLALDQRAKVSDPLAHWRAASEAGLVVSAPSRPEKLLGDEFREILDTFPDLKIVIEHLAGVGANAEAPYEAYREALKLAERPNLSIKLPGFGEICSVPLPFDPIPPLADMAIEAFGPERVMWGSDFPPVSSREGYGNALNVPLDYLKTLSESDREWIFGKTALEVWRFIS